MMSELTNLEDTQFENLRLRLMECLNHMNLILSTGNQGGGV